MKKFLVFGLLIAGAYGVSRACPFELTNDSPYPEIYMSQKDLGEEVSQDTLEQEVEETKDYQPHTAPVTSKATKPTEDQPEGTLGKVTGMHFDVFIPSKTPGMFERNYQVSIRYCAVEPEDLAENKIKYSTIEARDLNMKRFIIEGPQAKNPAPVKQGKKKQMKVKQPKKQGTAPKKSTAKAKKTTKKAVEPEMRKAPYVVSPELAAAQKVRRERKARQRRLLKQAEPVSAIEKDMPGQPEYFMGDTERYPEGILP